MSIDAKDLIKVIRACNKIGVRRLKTADVEIEFGPGEAAQLSEPQGETSVPPTTEELEAAGNAALREEGLNMADEELAHMQVENPAMFEEMLINREVGAIVGNDRGDAGAESEDDIGA